MRRRRRARSNIGEERRAYSLSKAKRRDGFPTQIAAEDIARASTHGGGGSGSGGGGAEHIYLFRNSCEE